MNPETLDTLDQAMCLFAADLQDDIADYLARNPCPVIDSVTREPLGGIVPGKEAPYMQKCVNTSDICLVDHSPEEEFKKEVALLWVTAMRDRYESFLTPEVLGEPEELDASELARTVWILANFHPITLLRVRVLEEVRAFEFVYVTEGWLTDRYPDNEEFGSWKWLNIQHPENNPERTQGYFCGVLSSSAIVDPTRVRVFIVKY